MLKRTIKVTFRVNQTELNRLKKQSKKTGYSQEAYIRSLINGYLPRESPPLAYHDLLRELRAIGNNLNQIAKTANTFGHIDAAAYQQEASSLSSFIVKIQDAVLLPDKI